MKELKKGEYLAPEVEVMEIQTNASVLTVSGGNEGLSSSGFSYGEDDFD